MGIFPAISFLIVDFDNRISSHRARQKNGTIGNRNGIAGNTAVPFLFSRKAFQRIVAVGKSWIIENAK